MAYRGRARYKGGGGNGGGGGGGRGAHNGRGNRGGGMASYSYNSYNSSTFFADDSQPSFQAYVGGQNGFGIGPHDGFSLADEARYTGSHRGNWNNTNAPLRYATVKFVPAASRYLEPNDLFKPLNCEIRPKDEDPNLSEESEDNTAIRVRPATSGTDDDMVARDQELPQDVDMNKLDLNVPEAVSASVAPSDAASFVVDVAGGPSQAPKMQDPIRAPSLTPSSSSSSSEEIVFVPRKNRTTSTFQGPRSGNPSKGKSQAPLGSKNPSLSGKGTKPGITTKVESTLKVTKRTTAVVVSEGSNPTESDSGVAVERVIVAASTLGDKNSASELSPSNKGRKQSKNRRARKENDEDSGSGDISATQDYVENVEAQIRAEIVENGGKSFTAMSTRSLGEDGEWLDDSSTNGDEELEDEIAILKLRGELWEPEDRVDFDALSTSSEGPQRVVESVLGRRNRPSGLQYLVNWVGDEAGNAAWILAEKLDSSSDGKVKEYEKALEVKMLKEQSGETGALSNGSGEDDSDDSDEGGNGGSEEDEKIARLLQEREEMGLADDLEAIDGFADNIMELDKDYAKSSKEKSKKGRKRAGKDSMAFSDITPDPLTGHFPSASGMADAYDGFDVMDWDRPSLKTGKSKRKGKGKMAQFDISDSEFEAKLQSSWQKDREKKKARKQEREALRAAGVLGGTAQKAGKRGPNGRFGGGMAMEEVQDEIRNFLISPHESLELPPMDKKSRKKVHQIAMAFNLKSKSTGTGKSRYPTLVKTSRSAVPGEGRGVMEVGVIHGRPAGGRRGGGGGVVHHREGDIVGAGAKEIAEDNRGRIMLEKMGYKSGMSLGADHNRGIVVPLAAVVKMGKAGLG